MATTKLSKQSSSIPATTKAKVDPLIQPRTIFKQEGTLFGGWRLGNALAEVVNSKTLAVSLPDLMKALEVSILKTSRHVFTENAKLYVKRVADNEYCLCTTREETEAEFTMRVAALQRRRERVAAKKAQNEAAVATAKAKQEADQLNADKKALAALAKKLNVPLPQDFTE